MSQVKYEYKGAKGLREIEALTGISRATIVARMRKRGWSVKEAVEYQPKVSPYEYEGHIGLTAIARAFGVRYDTLRHRVVNMGLSVEEALNNDDLRKGNFFPRKPKEPAVKARYPDLLDPRWALALGIGQGSH